jgi:hypothetical protein
VVAGVFWLIFLALIGSKWIEPADWVEIQRIRWVMAQANLTNVSVVIERWRKITSRKIVDICRLIYYSWTNLEVGSWNRCPIILIVGIGSTVRRLHRREEQKRSKEGKMYLEVFGASC